MSSEDSKKVIEERLQELERKLQRFKESPEGARLIDRGLVSPELGPHHMQEIALLVAALHIGNCITELVLILEGLASRRSLG